MKLPIALFSALALNKAEYDRGCKMKVMHLEYNIALKQNQTYGELNTKIDKIDRDLADWEILKT